MIEGLASLSVIVYYGWRANVAMLVEATASNPPDWVDDALEDYDKHVYSLTTILTDPVAVVESLAQTASDTYEKEGGTYAGAYLITDFLLGKALSGAGKADEITDVASTTSKMDELTEFAEDSSHYYDELDNIDNLDDYYDDIYDSYYKDPFDPVEDGAIADPGDIDDALKSVPQMDDVGKTKKKIKRPKKSSPSKRPKKISRKVKKKYIETIDDLVKRMKKEKIPKDISYEELVAKYGDEYFVKEIQAAYTKYTRKII